MSQPKKILITGANSGLGEALAYRFAAAGYFLILTYAHHKDKMLAVKDTCLNLGAPGVDFSELIFEDQTSLLNFLEYFSKQHDRIDILINNAGLTEKCGLRDLNLSFIQKQIEVNLTGPIKLTSQILPRISSMIINIGSNLSFHGKASMSVYTASKFGLRGFAQSLSCEVKNIRSYLVNPGNLGDKDNFLANTLTRQTAAEIIFKLASDKILVPSGADVQLREYLYGRQGRLFLKIFLFLKLFIKKFLRFFSKLF